MNQNNKFQPSKKVFSICIYAIITVSICAFIVKSIWNWSTTSEVLFGFLSNLSPFLLGFFIAYIMGNIMTSIDTHFLTGFLKLKNPTARKFISLFLSYILVIAFIAGALFGIIPSFISSVSNIADSFSDLYDNLVKYINDFNKEYDNETIAYIQSIITENSSKYIDTFQDWAASLVPSIATASVSFVYGIFDFIIAIIVSIYMLIDKNILIRNTERIIYSVFNKKKANYIWDVITRANDIFSGFIIGKTIDSLIIGILCLIIMSVFDIGGPYKVVISIFVGITNMIPYFGPFIGAIPSAIILLLAMSPKEALVFSIMILALQQFDGNILGPYILGDKTGLRPIWIIFAISVGGYLWGVVGMFLGVPFCSLVSSLLDDFVERGLDKHEVDLPVVTNEPSEDELSRRAAQKQKRRETFRKIFKK